MGSHYIDIQLLPDPEISPAHIMGALYGRLHLALVQLGAKQIGISFPEYRLKPRGVGKILRLHGSPADLQTLCASVHFGGIKDLIAVKETLPVPEHARHRAVFRRQFKTNVDRLRRRRMARHGESAEQAALAIPDSAQQHTTLPFVQLRSRSSAQAFCLFLAMGEEYATPQKGEFNTYGLSNQATIPWF